MFPRVLVLALLPVCLLAQSDAEAAQKDPAAFSALYGAITSGANYKPLTGKQRALLYWRQSYFNAMAPVRTLLPASIDHLNNEPPEWKQTGSGFGKRAADRFARFTSQDTMEAVGSGILGQEVRYISCPSCRSVRSRLMNAARQNIMTYDRNGHWAPAYARVGATITAEYLPSLWLPNGRLTTGRVVTGVATQMGFGTLNNLVKEFSPEIKKLLHRKK